MRETTVEVDVGDLHVLVAFFREHRHSGDFDDHDDRATEDLFFEAMLTAGRPRTLWDLAPRRRRRDPDAVPPRLAQS